MVFTLAAIFFGSCKKNIGERNEKSGETQFAEYFEHLNSAITSEELFENFELSPKLAKKSIDGGRRELSGIKSIWDFSKSRKHEAKGTTWWEVPFRGSGNHNFLLERSRVPGFINTTKPSLILIPRTEDTLVLLRLSAAELPTESSKRKQWLSKGRIRNTYYDVNLKLLADHDVVEGKLIRYQTTPLINGVGERVRRTVNCVQTTTKLVSCSGTMENTTCTFQNINTTRCTLDQGNPGNLDASFEPIFENGGGLIVELTTIVFQNQENIDSLPSYPCVQDVLSKLPSCDATLAKTIVDIFGISSDFNIRIRVKASFGKDSSDGRFVSGTINPDFFNGTMYLNPWVLNNSSKDYIASTIIHEGLHAVIGYWYTRYKTGVIDSNEFKAKFPIFWDYKRALTVDEMAEHEEFARRYINQLEQYQLLHNPGISQAMAKALAWGGLQCTTAWKALGRDTVLIKELNHIARNNANDISLFQAYGLKKCD